MSTCSIGSSHRISNLVSDSNEDISMGSSSVSAPAPVTNPSEVPEGMTSLPKQSTELLTQAPMLEEVQFPELPTQSSVREVLPPEVQSPEVLTQFSQPEVQSQEMVDEIPVEEETQSVAENRAANPQDEEPSPLVEMPPEFGGNSSNSVKGEEEAFLEIPDAPFVQPNPPLLQTPPPHPTLENPPPLKRRHSGQPPIPPPPAFRMDPVLEKNHTVPVYSPNKKRKSPEPEEPVSKINQRVQVPIPDQLDYYADFY